MDQHTTGTNTVELRDENAAAMDAFEQALCQQECVMQCYLVTGATDYVLFLCVKDMAAYERFVRQMLYSNSFVSKFTTLTVLRKIKASTKIPIPSR